MIIDDIINPVNKKLFLYLSKQEKIKHFVMTNKYAKKISRRWIAGETLNDALKAAENLNLEGRLVALDHLGEDVTNAEAAKNFAAEYYKIIIGIHMNYLNSNASLKLTQMGLDIDQELCYENVAGIIRTAKLFNNFIRIDMEGSDHTQKTIDLFKRLKKDYDNVGLVVQSYLYRTEDDVNDLLKICTEFRLCKGAYKEPSNVAFPKKKDVDKSFVKLSEKMLSSGLYHGFATHDEKMINHIKEFAKAEKISPEKFEFQMLYGVKRELQQKLVDEGYNLRVYTAYGEEWYPYTMRRFAESWHNVWFVAKDII